MIKKNELNKFGRNWRIRNIYVNNLNKYKLWLEHRHGRIYYDVLVFAYAMHCTGCDAKPPKEAEAIFRMIVDAYDD